MLPPLTLLALLLPWPLMLPPLTLLVLLLPWPLMLPLLTLLALLLPRIRRPLLQIGRLLFLIG